MFTFALLLSPALLLAQADPQPAPAPVSPPADWRFAHPDATLVGGVRVKALLESPIVAALLEEAASKDPNAAAMTGMLKQALGQVEEVRFSLLDRGNQQMDAVLMVTGQVEDGLATALTQGKAQARRIDDHTLLLGAEGSLEEAVQRMSEPPGLLHNRALVRGSGMTAQDLWLAGNLPDTPMTAGLNANLRGLAFGLGLSGGLTVELALDAVSPRMAEELIRSAHEAGAGQPDLAGRLETSVDDTTATFRVRMPEDEVLAAIRAGKVAQLFSQLGGTGESKEQAAPRRDTIIIEGLEGGTREIPVDGGH